MDGRKNNTRRRKRELGRKKEEPFCLIVIESIVRGFWEEKNLPRSVPERRGLVDGAKGKSREGLQPSTGEEKGRGKGKGAGSKGTDKEGTSYFITPEEVELYCLKKRRGTSGTCLTDTRGGGETECPEKQE